MRIEEQYLCELQRYDCVASPEHLGVPHGRSVQEFQNPASSFPPVDEAAASIETPALCLKLPTGEGLEQ